MELRGNPPLLVWGQNSLSVLHKIHTLNLPKVNFAREGDGFGCFFSFHPLLITIVIPCVLECPQ